MARAHNVDPIAYAGDFSPVHTDFFLLISSLELLKKNKCPHFAIFDEAHETFTNKPKGKTRETAQNIFNSFLKFNAYFTRYPSKNFFSFLTFLHNAPQKGKGSPLNQSHGND